MRRRQLGILAAALAASGPAGAQDAAWPNRVVRLIVGFPPGGSTDLLGRLTADQLTRQFRQQFIVENRGGAGSNIGMAEVARAAPDGYTLGWITVASHAINPTLYARMPFDHVKDFAPVAMVATLPNLLVVHNDVPARTVPELIALAKANPGKYTFASSGQGTSLHLSGEMFKTMAGVDLLHVPYRGGGQALQDLLSGQVHMIFGNIPTVIQQARAGKVRPLAVTSAERSPAVPDVPAMAEFLPGFLALSWGGIAAPAGTPRPIVERIAAALRESLATPEVIEKIDATGATPAWMGPEAFARFIAEDTERWAKVVRASGAKLE